MSVKCACGIETNEADGICAVCKMDARIKVEAEAKAKAKENLTSTLTSTLTLTLYNKPNGGEKMGSKTKCEVDGCIRQTWKEHRCYRHYKEKHGIVRKKPGPKNQSKKEIATPSARNDVIARSGMTKQSPPSWALSDRKIIDILLEKRKEIDITLNVLSEITGIVIPDAR